MSIKANGNADRLRAMGFVEKPEPVLPPLPEPEPPQEPLLAQLGLEGASIEVKSQAITEAWLGTLTAQDVSRMGATGVKEIAKLAGLGGTKKADPSGNAVIMAIIQALQGLGVRAPEMKVIEVEEEPQATLGMAHE